MKKKKKKKKKSTKKNAWRKIPQEKKRALGFLWEASVEGPRWKRKKGEGTVR